MADTAQFLTFLFTDIEGSTALWERHPAEMTAVLARHDEILRHAITAGDGTVIGGRGDGVFAVFAAPRNAVTATLDAQRALADEAWPEGMALRVRMGVHAGEANAREGDWFGTEVNRAARVMSVAHGGQVVCTRIVEELVHDDFDLVDLGEHRLRDLQSTVHLFQVEIPGSPAVHPQLRSIDAHLTNLPYELSSFIGRDREQQEVTVRLEESRLVSIVGVGGVGKTRLALQVGAAVLHDHPDGVWLCELAAVDDPADLHDAVASAIRYTPPPGVTVALGLQRHLEHQNLLLLLDNCEHLVGAVAMFVDDTAAHAAGVSVLATTREALGVRGEHIFPLPSLTVPPTDDPQSVLGSEAGALFAARAREAGADVTIDERTASAIRAVCTRLDGIPLAIELAAAQAALMTPVEIERRLDRQFTAATGGRRGAMERHQTLRAAIDWSHDLLSPGAQELLARLSVCVGGFDLDAADALGVGADGGESADAFELLRELVGKSLVERYEASANTRYRLLEMIRQYAAERLEASGGAEATRDLHAAHHAQRLAQIGASVSSDDEWEALDTLALETPNIAAGLEWWLATGRTGAILQCFGDMPFFDGFAAPPITLEELTPIARAAIDTEGAERLPGFARTGMFVCFQAFLRGDIDDYRHLTHRTAAGGDSVVAGVTASCLAMFEGDMVGAGLHSARAAELARSAEPQLLAWTLAHRATLAGMVQQEGTAGRDADEPVAHAYDALAVARSVPGTIARQYPLLAIANCCLVADDVKGAEAARGLAAADEVTAIDHTQRRFWSTTVASAAANVRAARGDPLDQLTRWRESLLDHKECNEPFLFIILIATMSESLVDVEPAFGIELAAIAERGVIAPTATFTVFPKLLRAAAAHPEMISEARARAAVMSRDQAYAEIFHRIDELIARHGLDA